MKVFFDTSVLVSAVVNQLPRHRSALECFLHYTSGKHSASISTHALAEAYATLTALPLPRRISSDDARKLIETNFLNRLEIIEISRDRYADGIRRTADLGLTSGIVYDALHLACAESTDCQRLYTYNLAHFNRLNPVRVSVTSP